MVNIRGFARLGTIAVGLGIGAAVAHSPVASADTSTDWLSSIDTLLTGGTFPALATSALDYQISFDGYDLFPTTGNLATATMTAGEYGLAIAYGDGANASAVDGTGNVAVDIGNNSDVSDEVIADDGNGNVAVDIGNDSGQSEGVVADDGDGNSAVDIGNHSDLSGGVVADDGDGNSAIAVGANDSASAGEGNNDFAEVIGPESSSADAFDGNHDIAYVLDPFGSTASSAFSGDSNYDLAAVLLTDGSATAQNSDYLYDIISALGNESGVLPTSLATLLTDLSALF